MEMAVAAGALEIVGVVVVGIEAVAVVVAGAPNREAETVTASPIARLPNRAIGAGKTNLKNPIIGLGIAKPERLE